MVCRSYGNAATTSASPSDVIYSPGYVGCDHVILSLWIVLSVSLCLFISACDGNDVILTLNSAGSTNNKDSVNNDLDIGRGWEKGAIYTGSRQIRRLAYKGPYAWSTWSNYTLCSKTCGIGIQTRKRKCFKVTTYRKKQVSSLPCPGKDTEYRLCNTQKCQNGNDDTRLRACAAYNDKYYKGHYFKWKAISKESVIERGYSPCTLVCQAESYPFQTVAELSDKVPDGTSCVTARIDGVCLKKQCIPIGCDVKLTSTKTYDVCGVCGGDNTTCDVNRGQLSRMISYGYTTLLTLPKKARNIAVSDISKVSAVFALRGSQGIYFVGGRLTATHVTEYGGVANTTFFYYHPMYNKHSLERLEAEGPTNETLYVMMLSAEESSKILVDYRYSVPKQVKYERSKSQTERPEDVKRKQIQLEDGGDIEELSADHSAADLTQLPPVTGYSWVTNAATQCSRTCDHGVQTKYVRCVRDEDGQEVADSLCDARTKPAPLNIECKTEPCEARWEVGVWQPCSTSCGEGQQTRSVRCWRLLAPGFDSSVLSSMCQHLPKPPEVRHCISTDCGPVWLVSEWSNCSSKCGRGIQKRDVICSSTTEHCLINTKPISFRQCSTGPCYNKWLVSKWSSCSGRCGVGFQYRRVSCVDPAGSFVDDENCDQNRKPLSVQACGDKANCGPVWVPQTWSKCSVVCGEGLKSRAVACGEVVDSEFKVRNDPKCGHLYKPATRSRCREDPCPAQWFTSSWSSCSKSCGTEGYRTRRVSCFAEGKPSKECDETVRPPEVEACNRMSCDQASVSDSQQAPEGTKEDVCVDKSGINCRDVVMRNGCNVARYRKLCCRSCKIRRISLNTTTHQNAIAESFIQR